MAGLSDLARMTSTTVGTGTITLGVAVSPYLTFDLSGLSTASGGVIIDYGIQDVSASEIGTGTYTSSSLTLTRTPTKSTNGNAAIAMSGAAQVFVTPRAETLNDAGLFTGGTLNAARLPFQSSAIANSLAADVLLSNTATYFDGPSVAQGTVGTWFASGTITLADSAGAAQFQAKLWDGTTVIASGDDTQGVTAGFISISLSGFLTTPASNIKISCKDVTSSNGKIFFNATGNSKDSTITAFRIA
jgi:hypothetical protein